MPPSDPFPIELCSPRLKSAILAEFQGRRPTVQEMVHVPLATWMKVPGIGQALLMELSNIVWSHYGRDEGRFFTRLTDAELIARLERLKRDLKRFRHDIQGVMNERQVRAPGQDGED